MFPIEILEKILLYIAEEGEDIFQFFQINKKCSSIAFNDYFWKQNGIAEYDDFFQLLYLNQKSLNYKKTYRITKKLKDIVILTRRQFDFNGIESLYCQKNLEIIYNMDIKYYLTNINYLINLSSLSLMYCEITKIPNSIGKLKFLTILNLSHNFISHLPETIGNLIDLSYLDITHNPIKFLPNSIIKLKKLKDIFYKIEKKPIF